MRVSNVHTHSGRFDWFRFLWGNCKSKTNKSRSSKLVQQNSECILKINNFFRKTLRFLCFIFYGWSELSSLYFHFVAVLFICWRYSIFLGHKFRIYFENLYFCVQRHGKRKKNYFFFIYYLLLMGGWMNEWMNVWLWSDEYRDKDIKSVFDCNS